MRSIFIFVYQITEEEVRFASDILLEPFQDRFDMLGKSNHSTLQILLIFSISMLTVKSNVCSHTATNRQTVAIGEDTFECLDVIWLQNVHPCRIFWLTS